MSKASKGPSGKHHLKLLKETFGLGKPTWTQKDVPDQTGKVVIVTGGSSGLGKATIKVIELCSKCYIVLNCFLRLFWKEGLRYTS